VDAVRRDFAGLCGPDQRLAEIDALVELLAGFLVQAGLGETPIMDRAPIQPG
jgi:hypothetical protein